MRKVTSVQFKRFLIELKKRREDDLYVIDFELFDIHLLKEVMELVYLESKYNEGSVVATGHLLNDGDDDEESRFVTTHKIISYLALTSHGQEILNSGIVEHFLVNENELNLDNADWFEEITGLTVFEIEYNSDGIYGGIGHGREDVIFFGNKSE